MKKKICIITGSRAEYGLLRRLISLVNHDHELDLNLIVTGTHLSHEHGYTVDEIRNDGTPITSEVEILLSSDTPQSVTKSTGIAMISFADIYADIKPDLIVILGDRFEILAAANAGHLSGIPIAHIHGGEVTEGAVDDAIRHSITKMSWWHFVATDEFKRRVVQLGEKPDRIFVTGGMGVDIVRNTKLKNREDLEEELGINFDKKNLLITYHPETLGSKDSSSIFKEIIMALEELDRTNLFFTAPNSDAEGKTIAKMIEEFVERENNAFYFKSLGIINFLSMLQFVDAMVGNSSSGLLEAPSFKIGTINIGNRQKGRPKSESIIDCDLEKSNILSAIKTIYTDDFQKLLRTAKNPYGDGGSSEKILSIIKNHSIPENLQKGFHDVHIGT